MTKPSLALLAILVAGTPAAASTLPDVGLPAGRTAVTLGLADASVDYAVTDRLQVGGGAAGNLFAYGGYGRATYSFNDTFGLHAAAGTMSGLIMQIPAGPFLFFGPAAAFHLGPYFTVRASLGATVRTADGFWAYPLGPLFVTPAPNLELGFRLVGSHELTLGGNSIIGWRGRF